MKNNAQYWSDVFDREIDYKNSSGMRFITENFTKKDKLLEAGCGTGRAAFKFAYKGYDVSGVDFSEDLIEFCQKGARKLKFIKPSKFKVGDIMDLPYKEDEFDVYLSFGVIEHFKSDEQEKIIQEAYRVIKKGGKAVITVPNAYTPNVVQRYFVSKYKKHVVKKAYGLSEKHINKKIQKMFEKEGFKTIKCYNLGFDKAMTRFLLLNYPKIFGVPNPLSYVKRPVQNISKKMEKFMYKFGETTVYVGKK